MFKIMFINEEKLPDDIETEVVEHRLPEEELEGAYLGLGSTYRTLGKYKESKKVFEEGIAKFPENNAIKVFYAMTLYNLKEHSKAMEILLYNISQTSSDENINKYKKAIEFYSNKLNEIW